MELDHLIVKIEADAKPMQQALDLIDKQASSSLGKMAHWGDKIGSSLAHAAVEGKSLGQVLKSLAADIAQTTLRQTVINPMGSLLGSALGGLFGRATGGSVSSGQPYMVGERGAELFIPSSAGRIEPASQTSSGSAAPIVTVNIDARGADSSAADRLKAAAKEIQEATFNAVFAAMERGGKYARMSGRRG